MKWHKKGESQPLPGVRILVFSPYYEAGDSSRFRIMDSQFFKLSGEATHWALLTSPEPDEDEIPKL